MKREERRRQRRRWSNRGRKIKRRVGLLFRFPFFFPPRARSSVSKSERRRRRPPPLLNHLFVLVFAFVCFVCLHDFFAFFSFSPSTLSPLFSPLRRRRRRRPARAAPAARQALGRRGGRRGPAPTGHPGPGRRSAVAAGKQRAEVRESRGDGRGDGCPAAGSASSLGFLILVLFGKKKKGKR